MRCAAFATIGVRYVLLHASDVRELGTRRLGPWRRCGRRGDQIAEEREWPGVWAWRLKDHPAAAPARGADLPALWILARSTVHASGHEDRLPLMFDGELDTRWISGDPQDGGEWIEIRFPHEVDVARVRFETSPRSVTDYPRRLAIDSADAAGAAHDALRGRRWRTGSSRRWRPTSCPRR